MKTELRFVLAVVLVVGVLVVTNVLFPPEKRSAPVASSSDSVAAGALGLSAAADPASPVADSTRTVEREREIVVAGRLYRHVFSTRGARLVSAELPLFKSFTREGSAQLVGDSATGALGLRLQIGRDTLDLRDAAFTPSSDSVRVVDGPTQLSFRHVEPDFTVEITYTFLPDDYIVEVDGTVRGLTRPLVISDLGRGLPHNDQDSVAESRSMAYVGNHAQRGIETEQLAGVKAASVEEGPFLWAAFKSKFFVFGLLRPVGDSGRAAPFGGLLVRVPEPGRVEVATTEPVGDDGRFGYRAYLGPLEIPRLSALGDDFDEVNQYKPAFLRAILRPIVGVMTSLFELMHAQLNLGYGWVLILFGILLRVALWPLNQRSMRAQMKNMAVQPLLKDIQTRYKDKPEKLQQEMMKLYKEHGFNPFAGCLPMLLQYPILISLYFVFQYSIALRGVSFGWLPDLSAPDPYYVLPLLMGASMFLLMWLNMRTTPDPNPQMKMMMWMMPFMMTFLFLRLAGGLNLYYAVSNLATIPQQMLIMRERQKLQSSAGAKAK